MSDRSNFYHGQTVMEDELDQPFTDLESADRDLSVDNGLAQELATASPDPAVYGGIVNGLIVTWNASGYLDITAGTAYDQLGRRIRLGSAATCYITKTGSTDEGDVSLAVGDGASIASSCPSGQRIVVSLFIVYDEALSDGRTDATGATVQHREVESFHFDLQIGTSFSDPPASAPSRTALTNGKVLIYDIVIQNTAGTLAPIAGGICGTDYDWDSLGGNYASNTGRRSDWLAMDQSSDFPQFDTKNTQLRATSPREAIHTLTKMLQVQASDPAGASLIGARYQVGTVVSPPTATEAAGVREASAGSVDTQVLAILNQLSNALYTGGNDVIKPASAANGLFLDPTNIGATLALLALKANVGGSVASQFIQKKRGHLLLPNYFYDCFNGYKGTNAGGRTSWTPGNSDPWAVLTVGGGGALFIRNAGDGAPNIGSILELNANGGASGDGVGIYHNHDGTNFGGGYNLGASPWASWYIRFRLPNVSDVAFVVSLAGASGNSYVAIQFDTSGAGKLQLLGQDSAAGGNFSVDILGGAAPTVDTWYTISLSSLANNSVAYQVNNGAEGTATLSSGTFANEPHSLYAICYTLNAGGAARQLYVDRVFIGEAVLPADML